jgi:hypothetical protein
MTEHVKLAAELIGYLTAGVIALIGLLRALNRLIKALPVTANNLRGLLHKDGWKIKRKLKLP